MTIRPYYTLCLWDADNAAWCDEFGSYERDECREEYQFAHDDISRSHMAIIKTDGTAADMIAKRDALPTPKK